MSSKQEEKGIIILHSNGKIRIYFSNPLKPSLNLLFAFGWLKGVKVLMTNKKIVGIQFDNLDVLERFYRNIAPEALPKILYIIKGEQHGKTQNQ